MARTIPTYPTWYIGIDPGGDGGMALINSDGTILHFDRINELPSIVKFFRHSKIVAGDQGARLTCVFEEYKGDGAANATRASGMYVGIVMTLCYVHGINLIRVAPQTWKAHHKLIIHQPKDQPKMSDTERYAASKLRSMTKFRELFHDVNIVYPRCKKEHEGTAEALLIAAYGQQLQL